MLPADFWNNERRRLLAVLGPRIEDAARRGQEIAAIKAGIVMDQYLANIQAANWARRQTDEVLAQLQVTSERIVGEALAEWIVQPGATMGELESKLTPQFGRERADTIAITETTRA